MDQAQDPVLSCEHGPAPERWAFMPRPGSRLSVLLSFLLAPRGDLVVVLHMWSSAGTFTLAFHMFSAR